MLKRIKSNMRCIETSVDDMDMILESRDKE